MVASRRQSEARRLAGRLSAGLLLQAIQNARARPGAPDDLVDTLIIVATLQANVGAVQRDPKLRLVHATLDAPPPDALRRARAVPASAIATSLGLPYETVRRRVARLVGESRLNAAERGIYAPQAAFASPIHAEASFANYSLLRRFYRRLRALELTPAPRRPQVLDGPPPVRAVVRALIDYVMRSVQEIGIGDIVDLTILLGVMRANGEHLPDRPPPGGAGHLRAVSALALGAQLQLPRETVRRKLVRLTMSGDCVRTEAGYLAPLNRPGGAGAYLASPRNLANLQRMFAGLDETGVLARWELGQGD